MAYSKHLCGAATGESDGLVWAWWWAGIRIGLYTWCCPSYERLKIDIEHLCLGKVPSISANDTPLVAYSKHLCGAATGESDGLYVG